MVWTSKYDVSVTLMQYEGRELRKTVMFSRVKCPLEQNALRCALISSKLPQLVAHGLNVPHVNFESRGCNARRERDEKLFRSEELCSLLYGRISK
jgi:hypothetical protein